MEKDLQQDISTPEEIRKILQEVSSNQKETDKWIKETAKRLNELLAGRWDEPLMESLVEGEQEVAPV